MSDPSTDTAEESGRLYHRPDPIPNDSGFLTLYDHLGWIPSWVATWLGSRCIGTPEELDVDNDFYRYEMDRDLLQPEDYTADDDSAIKSVYTNTVLRWLTYVRVGPMATLGSLVFVAAVSLTFNLVVGAGYVASKVGADVKSLVSGSAAAGDPNAEWPMEQREAAQTRNHALLQACAEARGKPAYMLDPTKSLPGLTFTFKQACGVLPTKVESQFTMTGALPQ